MRKKGDYSLFLSLHFSSVIRNCRNVTNILSECTSFFLFCRRYKVIEYSVDAWLSV